MNISIVMPVLNEADLIVPALTRLRRDFDACELVVVDGGSTDGTVELATRLAKVLNGRHGRARQMNDGAAHTSGDLLWFIHADTAIHPAALDQIRHTMADSRVVGGGLSLAFDRRSSGLDWLAFSSNWRARRLHQIFGDQAMFIRRSAFEDLGGFADMPILEDLEMSRRLHRTGRLAVLSATSTASARRFVEHGTWRMLAFMQYLKALYFVGVDPAVIAAKYAAGPRFGWRVRDER